ncbi:biotin-dependent carboxyltransferase family protein [Nocardioides sp.]|uniref:5-oxoprolinase subunit C family protein n=1 Tax=Nocardioides sp. TaxID=35761 RepID=UPI003516521D
MGLLVRAVGASCLVQDAGRPGRAALGVAPSGVADRASSGLANRLLGNAPGAGVLEVLLGGLEVEATADLWVCVTGAPVPIRADGRARAIGDVVRLRRGERLALGVPARGLRAYLAVGGGVAAEEVLGSVAHDTLSGLGPPPVRVGDLLPVGRGGSGALGTPLAGAVAEATVPREVLVLRAVPGPHTDRLVDPGALHRTTWVVSSDSDRVGVRLVPSRGDEPGALPAMRHREGVGELPSEGVTRGTVQVPPSGLPVVLGADHPVTGGYPVVGVVLDADTDALAQARPGTAVRFVRA